MRDVKNENNIISCSVNFCIGLFFKILTEAGPGRLIILWVLGRGTRELTQSNLGQPESFAGPTENAC